ncbi:MAG: hypothetical protein IPL50_16295 [Chitinophagaceae bacterium]|nr:hypothetical protein [Chitinophagaceae bacterium]
MAELFYLSQGKLLEAVQYGVACGTAAAVNTGTGCVKRRCRRVPYNDTGG